MVETIVLNYLQSKISVPCSMQEPENKTPGNDTFVVLEKTGSSLTNHIFTATFAIQSYAPTLYEAAVLNEAVKSAMLNITAEENEITRVSLTSDYSYIKESTKQPRYQAVFELTHY